MARKQSKATSEHPGATAIRAILAERGIAIYQLADELGLWKTTVGKWLYGMRPSLSSAVRLRALYPRHITRAVLDAWGYTACR